MLDAQAEFVLYECAGCDVQPCEVAEGAASGTLRPTIQALRGSYARGVCAQGKNYWMAAKITEDRNFGWARKTIMIQHR
jgi:hypothetical protein